MNRKGKQTGSIVVFSELLEFVNERLEKVRQPNLELVREHNADPKNADWKLDPDAPFEQADVVHDLLAFLAERMVALNKERQKKMKIFLTWLETELEITPDSKGREGIEALTGKTKLKNYLGNYQKGEEALSFDEIWSSLRKNKSRIGRNLTPTFMQEVHAAYDESLPELLPIKERLRLTDALIDQIVYRLYNLTEEDVRIVEDKALLRQGIPNQSVDKT